MIKNGNVQYENWYAQDIYIFEIRTESLDNLFRINKI